MMQMHSLYAPMRDRSVTRVSVVHDKINVHVNIDEHESRMLARDQKYDAVLRRDAVAECTADVASETRARGDRVLRRDRHFDFDSTTDPIPAFLPSIIYESMVRNINANAEHELSNVDQAAAVYTAKPGRHAAFGTSGTLRPQKIASLEVLQNLSGAAIFAILPQASTIDAKLTDDIATLHFAISENAVGLRRRLNHLHQNVSRPVRLRQRLEETRNVGAVDIVTSAFTLWLEDVLDSGLRVCGERACSQPSCRFIERVDWRKSLENFGRGGFVW